MINKINEIIDEKEQYQLQALRLEAENKRLKEVIIKALKDTVIQWKKEYEILDSIIEIKDVKIKQLKAENARLRTQYNCYACGNCKGKEDYINLEKHHIGLRKQFDKKVQTLQEIKKFAERQLLVTNVRPYQMVYYADFSEYRNEILQKITKAESEEE